jgi:hypothetical protein
MDPIDIWRSAKLMVKRYGDGAPAQCVGRAARFGLQGDRDGEAAWLAIERAAKSLLETGRPTDIDSA